MKKLASAIGTAVLIVSTAFAAPNTSNGGDTFQPHWVDSLKVTAEGTGGRTATKTFTISAGPDRVFLPDTIRFVENSGAGGSARGVIFHEEQYVYRDVPVVVDGINYALRMPQTIVVTVYSQTGSGLPNYNRTAWLNGYVHAETLPISRTAN